MKKKNIVISIIILIMIIAISIGVYKFIDAEGKKYEITKINQYNYFIVKHNNKYGVIDRSGNNVISADYEEVIIPNPEKDLFICYQNKNSKVLNKNNEEILKNYNQLEAIRLKNIASDLMYEKSVLKFSKDEKYGLVDFNGKEIAKPIYEEIDSLPYKEGELLVKQNGKYGVINIKGNKLIDIQYEKINVDGYYIENEGYKNSGYIVSIKTEEGYRFGYINNKGENLIKTEFNELNRVTSINDNNIYLIGAKNGQFGVIKNDNVIIANEYQSITYDATNKVFVAEKSKKYGIFDLDGKQIVPVKYNQIDITGVYLYAQNDQGTTVYNSNGTEANINSNIAILNTSNDKYKIRINNENGTKYGIINKEGKKLVEEKYNYISYLYENYFIVSKENGKLGVIDDKDNIKIEIKYDSLQKIEDTDLLRAAITSDNTTHIFYKDMTEILNMKNAIIEKENEHIKIYNDEESKYISLEGKELKNIDVYSKNKLFTAVQNNKWGFVNNSGNVVVEYKYEKATEFNEYGFAAVKKNGKWGAINEEGKEIVEPKFEFNKTVEPSFIGKYYKVIYAYGEFYFTDDI